MIDRVQAQQIADLLGIDVSGVPGDEESLTVALWDGLGLTGVQMPEPTEARWGFMVKVCLARLAAVGRMFGGY